jgi:spore maturation protein CgeB
MKIAFYGSSLLSSYWNGAATYYRGLIRALAARGHSVTFYEPDAFDRQSHRDIDPPDWCRVRVYTPDDRGLACVASEAAAADVVVKASGVGVRDDDLLLAVMAEARLDALRLFWDVDAPATLAEIADAPDHPLRRALPVLDGVFTYGGGPGIEASYRALGARACTAIYNALDPESHFPVPPDPRFAADLAFLGNRLPDREARVARFFLDAARRLPERALLLGGAGWDGALLPPNVQTLGHVATAAHNAFNATPRAVLNISRESMAARGFSPATRVFEAAGAAACLITDAWEGIELFLAPGSEVLVARDGADVAEALATLDPARARAIGAAARARVLAEHTYDRRALQVEERLRALAAARAAGAAA